MGLFAILMLQGVLSPVSKAFPGLTDLAFNTASFALRTRTGRRSGESASATSPKPWSVQNFVTPAVGLAVLFALPEAW